MAGHCNELHLVVARHLLRKRVIVHLILRRDNAGPFNGLQAEYARISYANAGQVKLPKEVTDDQAIMISDIFPTGYFGADIAEIQPGDIWQVHSLTIYPLFLGAVMVRHYQLHKARVNAGYESVIYFNVNSPCKHI